MYLWKPIGVSANNGDIARLRVWIIVRNVLVYSELWYIVVAICS